jgi:phage-related protein
MIDSMAPIKRAHLGLPEDHLGDTYRAVYTVKIAERVYVLHRFLRSFNH